MRVGVVIGFTVVLVTALIVGGICYGSYLNRNKKHVYSADEVYSNTCATRGGNATTRQGYDNGIYIQEYKCEVAK